MHDGLPLALHGRDHGWQDSSPASHAPIIEEPQLFSSVEGQQLKTTDEETRDLQKLHKYNRLGSSEGSELEKGHMVGMNVVPCWVSKLKRRLALGVPISSVKLCFASMPRQDRSSTDMAMNL